MKKVIGVITAALITVSAAHAQSTVTRPTAEDLPKRCLDAALASLSGKDLSKGYFSADVTDGSRSNKRVQAAYDAWFKLGKNTADLLKDVMKTSNLEVFNQANELYWQGENRELVEPRFYADVTPSGGGQAKLTVTCRAESCGSFGRCASNVINPSGKEFSEKMKAQAEFFSKAVKLARLAGISPQRIRQESASFKKLQKRALRASEKLPLMSHTIVYESN